LRPDLARQRGVKRGVVHSTIWALRLGGETNDWVCRSRTGIDAYERFDSDGFDMQIRVFGYTGDGETRVTNACRARNGKSRTKSPLPLGHGHRIVHSPDIARIIEAA
jgi:hypothetical protein